MLKVQGKKRILFIVQLPPPVHGACIMNSLVVNSEVIKKSFLINVINLDFSQSIKEVARFSFVKVIKGVYYGFVIVKRILFQNPDLVYFTISPTGFAFYRDAYYVLLLKLLNKVIVYHLHGKGVKDNIKGSFFKKHLFSWIFKNSQVICLSKKLTEDIDEVCESEPFIVPNGIIPQLNLNVEAKKIHTAIPQILFLSNYIRDKGVIILIEALYILKNQGYKFYTKFVGAPSDLTVGIIEGIISDKGLSGYAKVTGPLYGVDKSIEFQKSDIFVLPTFNEAFPLVILEAMQYGLPVISTFEGGIPDMVVNNETGLLVESRNAEILADKIAILLKDEDLRLRMGKKGFERLINNYTLYHFEHNMNKVFHSILDNHY